MAGDFVVRTFSELLALPVPEHKFWIDPHLLPVGGSMFIYGKAQSWKSFLAIEAMYKMAQGKPWLIYPTTECKVMVVQSEQVEPMYQDRMMSFAQNRLAPDGLTAEQLDKNMVFVTQQDLKLDEPRGLGLMETAIKNNKPQVVIIDCLYRSVRSTKEETSVKPFLDGLSLMQGRYGVAFIIIHHPRKEPTGDDSTYEGGSFDDMTGWAGLGYWADTILRVDTDKDLNMKLTWEKVKNARSITPNVRLKIDQANLKFLIR